MPRQRYVTGLRLWLAMAIIYVLWGSTYFGIAVAIETIPPFLMAAFRFVVAGAALIAWQLVRDPGARHWPTRRQIRDSAIVGALLLGVGNGFVAWGEQTVPSGIAAIIIGLMPLGFALLGWIYFRDRLPRIVAAAVALGFAGVALLVWPAGDGANHFDPIGLFVLFLAPVGWGHGSLFAARRAQLPERPLIASGLQMLAGGAFLMIEAILTGEPARFRPDAVSFESLAAVAYLTVFGSMVAFTTYGWLLRHAPISLVSTYAYVNPVVAVALGTVFLHEEISLRTIIASAIILAAVAIIVTARSRLPSPPVDRASRSSASGRGTPSPASPVPPAAASASSRPSAAASISPVRTHRARSG
jgi:drug/metabolite transporter (DMT)-like permease